MSAHFERIVVFLVMSFLVLLFSWIYMRDRQQRIGLWMIGWISIFIHFTAALLASFSLISSGLADWMAITTLEIAGMSFLLSVSKACASPKRRAVFLALIGVPSLVYTTLWTLQVRHAWMYQSIVALSIVTALALSISYYDRKKPLVYVLCFPFAAPGLWVLYEVGRDPVNGVVFFLAEYFAITGLLYWQRFRRFTPGVITTSLSFLAWGAIFPIGQILPVFHVALPPDDSVFWDLPKYFVAFGMILTLFENQAKIATRAAKQFKVLFEGNLAAVYVSTFEGVLLDCNSAFVSMYGFESKTEALSRSAVSFYSGVAQREAFLRKITRDGRVLNYESQQRRKDGSSFWILARATIVTEPSGRRVIEGTSIDITERKQAEMSLKQSEERFATIFRHSPVACAIISPEGTILDVNENASKLSGLAVQQIIGKSSVELGFQKSHKEREALMDRLRAEGSLQNVEVEFTDAAGKQHVGLYFAALVGIGNMECNFAMLLDRTEQRELEARYRQAQKMEALGRLAGGVAHDFNNLLGVIGGYAELLEAKLGRDENYRRYCSKIIDTTQRASGLTRQLLTFSRKEIARPGPLQPHQALRELASMLARLIGEDIEMLLELNSRGTVIIDKTHFEQIIFNLVVNARDAMPNGGKLHIETADVAQASTPESVNATGARQVSIKVSDTGAGMDEHTRLHALEPFFTTKGLGHGTGLGLSTVYGIVQQCGGEIRIDSQPGEGTQITILLPAAAGGETADDQGATSRLAVNSGNILLVEREIEFRNTCAEYLSAAGYLVTCASDEHEALQHARGIDQLDLVISDMRLDEREFADHLAAMHPNSKRLSTSAYAGDPATPCLQKPFTLKQLGRKAQELITARPLVGDSQPARITRSELRS